MNIYQVLFLLSLLCSTTWNELCLQVYNDLILYLVRICFDYGLYLLLKYWQIRHNKFRFNLFHNHTKLLWWILHSFPCYQVMDWLILCFTYQVSKAKPIFNFCSFDLFSSLFIVKYSWLGRVLEVQNIRLCYILFILWRGVYFPYYFPKNYITKRRQIKRLFLTVTYFKIMVC